MFKPSDITRLFSGLTQHFQNMERDVQAVGRERRLMDAGKIVPLEYFLRHFANTTPDQSYWQKKNRKAAMPVIGQISVGMLMGELPFMGIRREGLPEELKADLQDDRFEPFKSQKMVEGAFMMLLDHKMRVYCISGDEDGDPYFFVPFVHLGHVTHLFDQVQRRDDFAHHTKVSAFFGGGQADLAMWRSINALKDYRELFNYPDYKPPKAGGNRPQLAEKSGVGAPAYNV